MIVRTKSPFNAKDSRATLISPVFIFSLSATLVVFSPMNSSRPAFSQHELHTLCELCSSSSSDLCVGSFSSAFLALLQKYSALTFIFSSAPNHSFTLFFTLAEISPVFATLTKSSRGVRSPRNRDDRSYPASPPNLPQGCNSTIVAGRTESENN